MSYLAKTPEDLLPCPHCGGEAKAFYDEAGGVYEVQCQECGAEPYIGCRRGAPGMRTLGDVIKAWNRRAGSTCEQRRTRRACYVECSNMEIEHGDYAYLEVELSCGHAFTWDDGTPPDYCPHCGAKVVDEL